MENSSQLAPLMEISGVEAAFAMDQNGRLIASLGSPIFTADLLQRSSKRIMTLLGALSEYLRPAQEAILIYEHHLIILRRRDEFTLAVLAQNNVNLVALKLSGNLCLKGLIENLASATAPAAIPPLPAPAPRPAAVTQPPRRPASSPPPAKGAKPPGRGGGIWG